MSVVETVSVTVTQADVLYVSEQIKQDLLEFERLYPRLISTRDILQYDTAVSTFLLNYAISTIGFSVENPSMSHLVYHELRYNITIRAYTAPRTGFGGATLSRVSIPASSRITAWVVWSPEMLALSATEQERIVAGTGWQRPGLNYFYPIYSDGLFEDRTAYGAGPLVAYNKEYRMD